MVTTVTNHSQSLSIALNYSQTFSNTLKHSQSAPKTMYKPPYLLKYAGKATRFTCPACKTPHSFTRYIDGETHQPIHPTVGRCNREIKCGYHYTPRQYFADLRNQNVPLPNNHPQGTSHPNLPSPISHHHKAPHHNLQSTGPHPKRSNSAPTQIIPQSQPQSQPHSQSQPQPQFKPQSKPQPQFQPQPQPNQPEKPADFIPRNYLKRSLSLNSNFVRFLCKYFTDVQIAEAANNYLLGATRNKEVIFWQVDIHGKVRTGKIMQYNPQTGRRIKTGYGGINWVHNKLKKSNPAYTHFNLSQCYFGEHLLRLYPDKPVAIVEAEKTAVIASMIIPNYNWLAAGNLNGLTVEKSRALRDRTVILYPDAGCYNHWLRKAEQINQQLSLRLTVSNFPENFATPQQIHDGYDLADYILEQLKYTK